MLGYVVGDVIAGQSKIGKYTLFCETRWMVDANTHNWILLKCCNSWSTENRKMYTILGKPKTVKNRKIYIFLINNGTVDAIYTQLDIAQML